MSQEKNYYVENLSSILISDILVNFRQVSKWTNFF